MIATIMLVNTTTPSHNYHFLITLKIYSLNNLQAYKTVLFITVTMLYPTFFLRNYLQIGSCAVLGSEGGLNFPGPAAFSARTLKT